ncbi:MAG TPA: DUF3007 family protein [Trichocoleus sp.]
MRRIDVLGVGFGVFLAGGAVYLALNLLGLDALSAGIWSQVVLVGGLIGWLVTYLSRVLSQNMTYNQQVKDYEDAVLQKRLAEMSPEELAALQAEIEADQSQPKG